MFKTSLFGDTGQDPVKSTERSTSTSGADLFLNKKAPKSRGINYRRFWLPEGCLDNDSPLAAVIFNRWWFAKNPNGRWEPRFGYDPFDKRPARPMVTNYKDPKTLEWYLDYWDDPVTRMIWETYDKDQIVEMKAFPQEQFYLQVYDVTSEDAYKEHLPSDWREGKVRILGGSSSKEGIHGETMIGLLLSRIFTTNDSSGKVASYWTYPITLEIKRGKKVSYQFSSGVSARIPKSYLDQPHYDIARWVPQSVWPAEAIQDVMQGSRDWDDAVNHYGIQLYPDEINLDGTPIKKDRNVPKTIEDDEDIPF